MIGVPLLFAEPGEQGEHLRLGRGIERRRGSSAISKSGYRDRDGDHDALSHPSGVLVGVVVEATLGLADLDLLKQFGGPLARRGAAAGRAGCTASASITWEPIVLTGSRAR